MKNIKIEDHGGTPQYLQHTGDEFNDVCIRLAPKANLQYLHGQHLDTRPQDVSPLDVRHQGTKSVNVQHPTQHQNIQHPNTKPAAPQHRNINTSVAKKINFYLQKQSTASIYLFNRGGYNLNVHICFEEPEARASLRILNLFEGKQIGRLNVVLEHRAPHTTSHLLAKSVLADTSQHILSCRQVLNRQAQHTDSQQKSQHLLLSPRARVQTFPQLEVQADDVTATHGATVGPLDEGALFYLNTRGANASQAQQLLTQAFVHDVLPAWPAAFTSALSTYIKRNTSTLN